MWLNSGRFLDNGKCGYILKPDVMLQGGFNPFDHSTYAQGACGVTIGIRVCLLLLLLLRRRGGGGGGGGCNVTRRFQSF